MKAKLVIFALILLFCGGLFALSIVSAADWSQYESGRDNIRLDGYQSQPGYIKFTDGNGTITGILWAASNHLYFATTGYLDLTTTKISGNNSGNAAIVENL